MKGEEGEDKGEEENVQEKEKERNKVSHNGLNPLHVQSINTFCVDKKTRNSRFLCEDNSEISFPRQTHSQDGGRKGKDRIVFGGGLLVFESTKNCFTLTTLKNIAE